jgi:hypothetical protein
MTTAVTADAPEGSVLPLSDAVQTRGLVDPLWQMAMGERAALIGVLADLRPTLSIEIGTAQGGSLRQIAKYSAEVRSFDLTLDLDEHDPLYRNVTFEHGDSHVNLPRVLRDYEASGRNVDFVLIDGDHSREGVFLDLQHVLTSAACRDTVVLLHDTANPACRAGMEDVRFESHPQIAHVDLDFVPATKRLPLMQDRWGGLGLMVLRSDGPNYRLFDETIRSQPRETSARGVIHDLAGPARTLTTVARKGTNRLVQRAKALR